MALDYEEIGTNIRLARTRNKLKQRELASLIHVSSQHLCHIETSKSSPSLQTLVDIANSLETTVDALLGENLIHGRHASLQDELAAVLSEADEEQLKLCIRLYRAVVEQEG